MSAKEAWPLKSSSTGAVILCPEPGTCAILTSTFPLHHCRGSFHHCAPSRGFCHLMHKSQRFHCGVDIFVSLSSCLKRCWNHPEQNYFHVIPALSLLAGTLDVVLGLCCSRYIFLYSQIFLVFISILVRGTVQGDRPAGSPKETIAGQKHRSPARVDASKGIREKTLLWQTTQLLGFVRSRTDFQCFIWTPARKLQPLLGSQEPEWTAAFMLCILLSSSKESKRRGFWITR